MTDQTSDDFSTKLFFSSLPVSGSDGSSTEMKKVLSSEQLEWYDTMLFLF